ncbi:hypothetical protein K469DRAFT_361308 [Zopfia rhizophila CBS 207.26]|uniref:Conotoxin n=1 Tax=Zopfia rhizophila CBS 207.26 TaxID=1314779 RepID=A0A6A6ELL9_9PEZI|nr:hypothetical protein K469DRAFT_361308 [Zopfia rhizophila CBS 207.26]
MIITHCLILLRLTCHADGDTTEPMGSRMVRNKLQDRLEAFDRLRRLPDAEPYCFCSCCPQLEGRIIFCFVERCS